MIYENNDHGSCFLWRKLATSSCPICFSCEETSTGVQYNSLSELSLMWGAHAETWTFLHLFRLGFGEPGFTRRRHPRQRSCSLRPPSCASAGKDGLETAERQESKELKPALQNEMVASQNTSPNSLCTDNHPTNASQLAVFQGLVTLGSCFTCQCFGLQSAVSRDASKAKDIR
ncbi:hypothetical protein BaRGS_00010665 [Batillaria attramentaria]|uniref:Uncharacterized protein n=1 Tax=Batillaria attramentaria TaxID=370345 RepID=A0ABD0LF26_9CAEN